MDITVKGLTAVVDGLENASRKVRFSAFRGVTKALERGLELSRAELTDTDHSLKELAAMGHPYGNINPQVIHDPDTIVHAQTGAYVDALRVTKPKMDATGDIFEGEIKIADEQAKLDRWIQTGTTKMRARPWMQDVMDHNGDELSNLVRSEIEVAIAREAFGK